MPYRICKTYTVDKSCCHVAKALSGMSEFQDEFCLPKGLRRSFEITLEVARIDDVDVMALIKAFERSIGDYIALFDHAVCINVADRMLETFKRAYGRVILFDGEPTNALIAKTVYDRSVAALSDERFVGLAGRVRVLRVRVQEDESDWAEYSE